jgi:hypothetical protein
MLILSKEFIASPELDFIVASAGVGNVFLGRVYYGVSVSLVMC